MLVLELQGGSVPACEKEIRKFLYDFEKKISLTEESSEINAFNAAEKDREIALSEHVYNVLEKALFAWEETGGAFNPCLYEVAKLWGFTPDAQSIQTPPDGQRIQYALQAANPAHIVLNSQKRTALKTENGVKVDLGGIAKGYALGVCRQIAARHNVRSGTINIAGNIYVINRHQEGRKYKIGIEDPRGLKNDNALFAKIHIEDTSVSVSGDYQRFFEYDGIRYCHIINPASGMPVSNGVISAAVVGKDAALADAYSTAVMVKGLEEGYALMEELDLSGVIITENGYLARNIEISGVFEKYGLIEL